MTHSPINLSFSQNLDKKKILFAKLLINCSFLNYCAYFAIIHSIIIFPKSYILFHYTMAITICTDYLDKLNLAKLVFGGLVLYSSQVLLLHQLSQKMALASKVIKSDK
jgi:hypothetical protein